MPYIPIAVVNESTPVSETLLEQYVDAVLANSPVGYWKMDESSGLPQDSSGNGNHMTAVTGSPSYQQAGPFGAGSIELAIEYPSAANHERAVVSTATANITVEMWVRRNGGTSAGSNIFHHGTTSGGFEIEYSNTIGAFRGNLPGVGTLGSMGTIPDTTWTYIALRRETTTWTGYLIPVGGSDTVSVPGTASPGTPVGNTRILGTAATSTRVAHLAYYESAVPWEQLGLRYLIAAGML